MYRVVQQCQCGCGKRRAVKSPDPIIHPGDYKHDNPVDPATQSFASHVSRALSDPEVAEAWGQLIDQRLACLSRELEIQFDRIGALEDRSRPTLWGRLKFLFTGR